MTAGDVKYISNSQLELLLECSWKHRLKYIEGIAEPTSEHLLIGAAVHKGVEAYRIAQIEGRSSEWSEYERNEIVLKAMNDEFDQLLFDAENGTVRPGSTVTPIAGVNWTNGMTADTSRKLAKELLATYFYKSAESDISGMSGRPLALIDIPISIEEEFFVPIPGTNNWHAKGRFDMRTKDALVDLKTAKAKYTQRDMDKKTQPSFYSMSYLAKTGEFIGDFRYHILVKPNRSVWSPGSGDPPSAPGPYRAVVQRTRRTPGEIRWFVALLQRQIRQIEAGAQVPRQNADWCDYCGVAKACKPWLADGGRDDTGVLELLREEMRASSVTHEA